MTGYVYFKAVAFIFAGIGIFILGLASWNASERIPSAITMTGGLVAADARLAIADAVGTTVPIVYDAIAETGSRVDAGIAAANRALSITQVTADRLTDPEGGVVAVMDRRLLSVEDNVSSQLATANHTLALTADQLAGPAGSVTLALARYRVLPDELGMRLAPAWASLEPEITCRQLDGAGYGGCMRGRINGLLGEAERTGAQITKDSPVFLEQFTGITTDVHKFTTKAVAPRGVGGTIKDILSTGSGVVRAAGAAGLF